MSDGLVLVRGVDTNPPPLAALNQLDFPPVGTLVAVDFETRGTNAAAEDFTVVGAGIAWKNEEGNYVASYIKDVYNEAFITTINTYNCVAHNQLFDGSALYHIYKKLNVSYVTNCWSYCTYGLYRQLASEGHAGQRWGLKQAEVELLGWPESNEINLYEWLMTNGYTKGKGKTLKADPSEMWRAPAEILGPYCCLDAVACLQLYNDVLNPALNEFPQLRVYHQRDFLNENYLLIKQLFDGVWIDKQQLTAYSESLDYEIGEANDRFRNYPAVRTHLEEWNRAKVQEIRANEPSKFRKDGKESKLWLNWNKKVEDAATTDHFNINSNQQLQWLFYHRMGNPIKLRTDSGQPAVNTKALGLFGDAGARLKEYNEYTKEQSYVGAVLDRLTKDSILHLQFRNPGTLTERLAGGGSKMYKVEITTEDLDKAGISYKVIDGEIILDEK